MEKFQARHDCEMKGHTFRRGEGFRVLRTIMGECVLIIDGEPNVVVSEDELRMNGWLTGTPALGG